ncbi:MULTISPECIES: hypothetical protein [unclassified Caballeronia]|uniref:hypothetical protein n=1 Tax=unclassified Caballeronia TaxID=2646786 RepID=UPI00285F3AB2|nr:MULTISPECIES: hypothetical protein [unclassified Caballeronia]MDR5776261.1 hypothetical protein [Caballeronia sp. LZ002]MDR5851701.1 hypothetical protein [Caballeronia sp. LZ003]
MKTQLLAVSPAQARLWLEKNTDNRRLRPMVVENLRGAWERGEWLTTHQGIAFSTTGRLLDGQHRLTFISQLPDDEVVMMNVTTGMDEATFMVIDKGAVRTTSDTLGETTKLVAVARLLAKIRNGSQNAGLTDAVVAPYVDLVKPLHLDLMAFCPTNVRMWSSASVQAAAIYRMLIGEDVEFVKQSYRTLVHSDFESMNKISRAIYLQHGNGVIASARTLDLFVRCLKVFDLKKVNVTKIQINDMSATLTDVRATLSELVQAKKSPASAGLKVAESGLDYTPVSAQMSTVG